MRYTYDSDGALSSITAPDALAVTYTYDPGSPPPDLPDTPFAVLFGLLAIVVLGGSTLWILRSRRTGARPGGAAPTTPL